MKIVYVAGGSYKSFYINCFCKLKKCNLLIFNFGIIYNYITKDELFGSAIVSTELLNLSSTLNTVVVAGVYKQENNILTKCIIWCDGGKIHITNVRFGARIRVNNQTFIVGDEFTDYKKCNKIILCNKQIKPCLLHCSLRKIYVFCDKFGVNVVQNKKLSRKFNKYSKIILK